MEMRKTRRKRVAVASMAVALAAAGSAAAFQQLPAADQVNNDPAAGINPASGSAGGSPNADVVGGGPLPRNKRAVGGVRARRLRGRTKSSRVFINGAWTTHGAAPSAAGPAAVRHSRAL